MDSTGKRIKFCREKKGITQDELADFMGKSSKQTISSWENDKNEPTLSDLKKLAGFLNTTVAFLIGEEQQANPVNSDFTLIHKDELIELQRMALSISKEEIKQAEKKIEGLKKDEVVFDKP